MKKGVIFLLLTMASWCSAQMDSSIVLDTRLQYGYNTTWQSYGLLSAMADFKIAPNFRLAAGFCAQTSNVYAAAAQGKVFIPLKEEKHLYIINQYLYRGFNSYNFQEFNAGISLGYSMNYFNISLGTNIRLISQLRSASNGDIRYITEPYNVIYLVEGKLKNNQSPWNVGFRISNMRQFVMERMYQPTFSFPGYWQYSSMIRFVGECGLEPAGIFNVAAVSYDYFIQLGVQWLW